MKMRVLSLLLALCLILSMVPVTARAEQDIIITRTDIEADSVVNYDGYASIRKRADQEEYALNYALIDRTGKILQSYTETEEFALGTYGYQYSEGFVTINSTSSGYVFEEISSYYYNLDGTVAFEIESMEEQIREEILAEDPDRWISSIERSSSVKPIRDGVAFVRDHYMVCSSSGSAGSCGFREYSYLINSQGQIIYTFPEEFNEMLGGGLGVAYSGNCGWAGEGLIPVYCNAWRWDEELQENVNVYPLNGYMDYSGNMVLDFLGTDYTNCYPFADGRAMVCVSDSKYGFIDKTGKEVISAQYDEGISFEDGLAAVCKDGKWGAIDINGKVVIPLMYEEAYGTGEGYMAVGMDGKFGLVDVSNRVVVPLEYDDISIVADGVAYAIQDGVLHIIEINLPYNPFTDVPSDKYYYEPVLWAYENGITAGATATTFNPDGNCTRAQVVTFLWRAAGKPEPTTTNNPFTDVDSDDYFYKAVLWAVEEGVTAGATATTFNPKGACNRAQVVTFMYRAAGSPAVSGADNPFADVPADKYYHDAVLWAVENGITSGISATKFAPNNTCTRAQIVTFLYRGYAE